MTSRKTAAKETTLFVTLCSFSGVKWGKAQIRGRQWQKPKKSCSEKQAVPNGWSEVIMIWKLPQQSYFKMSNWSAYNKTRDLPLSPVLLPLERHQPYETHNIRPRPTVFPDWKGSKRFTRTSTSSSTLALMISWLECCSLGLVTANQHVYPMTECIFILWSFLIELIFHGELKTGALFLTCYQLLCTLWDVSTSFISFFSVDAHCSAYTTI